jgi:membrane protein required for colicin V production
MTTVDYQIIALVALAAIVGIARGLLRETVALVTGVAALFIAWHYADRIEPYLGGLRAPPHVRPWAARAILLIGVLLVGAGVGAVLSHLVRLSLFRGTDRFLGFLFGVVRGVVILGVLVLVCQALRLDEEHWWRSSMLLPYGEHAASLVRSLVGDTAEQPGFKLVGHGLRGGRSGAESSETSEPAPPNIGCMTP